MRSGVQLLCTVPLFMGFLSEGLAQRWSKGAVRTLPNVYFLRCPSKGVDPCLIIILYMV